MFLFIEEVEEDIPLVPAKKVIKKVEWKYSSTEEAALNNDLEEMIKMTTPNKKGKIAFQIHPKTSIASVKVGNYKMLQWVIKNKGSYNWITMYTAAQNGRLDMMKLLFENNCQWDQRVASMASFYGHLDCLQYALENGCRWDEECLSNAAKQGHIDIVKYCLQNNCPTNMWTFYSSLLSPNKECLKMYLDSQTKYTDEQKERLTQKLSNVTAEDEQIYNFIYVDKWDPKTKKELDDKTRVKNFLQISLKN